MQLPKITPLARALLLALLHCGTSFLLFAHGGRDYAALSSASTFAAYSLASDIDLLLASCASALLLALTALAARGCPLACYARCTAALASYALGTAFSLLATLALVKVVARPAEDSLFWAQACVLFAGATAEGFLAVGEVEAVHECALGAAARRYSLAAPGAEAAAAPAAAAADAAAAAAPAKRPSGVTFSRLLSLSIPDWHYVSLGFVNLVGAAVAGTFIPGLTGQAIDGLAGPDGAFHHTLLLLLAATVASAVLTGLRGWCFTVAISRLKVRLRDLLLRSILAQEQAFFDATPVGDLVSRLASDTTVVGDQVSLNVNVFLRSAISALGALVFMFSLSWRLSLLAFCTIPPTILVSSVYGKFVQALSKRSQSRLAACSQTAEEALSAMATVRSFGAERRLADAHALVLGDFYMLQRWQADAYAYYAMITMFLPGAVTALVLYVGAALVQSGALTTGALLSFLLYQITLAGALASLGDIWSGLNSAVGAADKIFALIDRVPKVRQLGRRTVALCNEGSSARGSSVQGGKNDAPLALPWHLPAAAPAAARAGALRGRLALTNVCFAYPSRPEAPVLRGLTLRVEPGEMVALVGPSGGGKSSVVRLLLRLYEPQSGSVALDGAPLAAYDHEWLHMAIGCVSQEPVLFGSRPLWQNIAFALPLPCQEDAGAAGGMAIVRHTAADAFPVFKSVWGEAEKEGAGGAGGADGADGADGSEDVYVPLMGEEERAEGAAPAAAAAAGEGGASTLRTILDRGAWGGQCVCVGGGAAARASLP